MRQRRRRSWSIASAWCGRFSCRGRAQTRAIRCLVDVTEARRLATVRQEFVANLVHELKTPITSLRLTAESLRSDPPPKDRHRFAERLVREADLISKIIDNLRQLGDIETGL